MVVVGVIAAIVVVAVIALGVGLYLVKRRGEDPWQNEDLFTPDDLPVRPGSEFTSRFRRRGKASKIEAFICMDEVVHKGRSRETVWRSPVEIVDYSAGDIVEFDLVTKVPAKTMPSLDTRKLALRWYLQILIEDETGNTEDLRRSIQIGFLN